MTFFFLLQSLWRFSILQILSKGMFHLKHEVKFLYRFSMLVGWFSVNYRSVLYWVYFIPVNKEHSRMCNELDWFWHYLHWMYFLPINNGTLLYLQWIRLTGQTPCMYHFHSIKLTACTRGCFNFQYNLLDTAVFLFNPIIWSWSWYVWITV